MTTTHALREAKNRYESRRRRLVAYGLWQPFVPAEPARRHIQSLMEYGISIERMAEVSGLRPAVLSRIIYDFTDRPMAKKIRTETADKIFAIKPRFEYIHDRHHVDGTATRRRLQALAAIGYPFRGMGEFLPLHPAQVGRTARSARVEAGTHRAVAAAYSQLAGCDPVTRGIRPGAALRVRRLAAAQGWAPPIAWDDDTIGDPEAQPDWTGHCGTDRGWWMHRLQQLTVCTRCEKAHREWKATIAHLDPTERLIVSNQAKAEASNRGANLAHDGRELLAHGVDIEHAAERLGVTRQHLQQELLRHPAPAEAVAA